MSVFDAETQLPFDDPLISIGVLAQRVGLSVSAVRKYEKEGLIIAHRSGSGHRLFSHEDIRRVRNIHHMIQDLGLNIEGIRRMQSLVPCWDLLHCSVEPCNGCPAYADSSRPCWMIKGRRCMAGAEECRRCVVYRFGSLCTEDIKCLLREQNDFRNAGQAAKGLMQGKRHSEKQEG